MNRPLLTGLLLTLLLLLSAVASSRAVALDDLYAAAASAAAAADDNDAALDPGTAAGDEEDEDEALGVSDDRLGAVLQRLRAAALAWLRDMRETQRPRQRRPVPDRPAWPGSALSAEKRDSGPGMTLNTAEILFHALKKPRNTRLPLRNSKMNLKGLAELFKTGRKR